MRFRTKITQHVMLSSGLALLVAGLCLMLLSRQTHRNAVVEELQQDAKQLAQSLQAALLFTDQKSAHENLAVFQANEHMVAAVAITESGEVLAEYHREGQSFSLPQIQGENTYTFRPGHIELFHVVRDETGVIGTIYLLRDLSDLSERMWLTIGAIAGVLMLSLFLTMVTTARFQRILSRPIHELADTARRVSDYGEYGVRARKISNDELGDLTETFNIMLEGIQSRDAELEKNRSELESRVEARTAELAHLNEALERSNLELQQFAYIASHDLQTPLRSISGFVQLLDAEYGEKLDEEGKEWIGYVVDGTSRMQTLIRDLLSYSRIDSRARPFAEVSLQDVFNDAVHLLDASLRDANAKITHSELPVIRGDRSQLVQLMQNLLGNGIKYHGDAPPQIHVSAVKDDKEWKVSIRDNGIGIEPRFHDQIFEIFRRLHGQHEYPGTGIGLAVCRRVVVRHGGRIWLESDKGKGCTFHFTIPLEMPVADDAGASASEPEAEPHLEPENDRPGPNPSGPDEDDRHGEQKPVNSTD